MSYILEALKKSDAERKRGEVPTLDALGGPAMPQDHQNKSPLPWVLAGALAVAVLMLAGIVVFQPFDDASPSAPSAAQTDPFAAAKAPPKPEPKFEQEPTQEPIIEPEAMAQQQAMVQPPEAPEIIAEPNDPQPAPEELPEQSVAVATEPDSTPVPKPTPVAPTPITETPSAPKTTTAKPSAAPKQHVISQPSAKTYVAQAWSSIDKGLYNQALRNLDRAVDIEPTYADAWFARGWANEKSGKELSAIGDYGRAISVKPDHAFALFSRGYLNLYVGSAQSAVTDFVRTQGVAQDQSLRLYSHLWLYLSRTRAQPDQDATARLSQDTTGETLDTWPGPLVRHFLGQMETDRVIAAIQQGPGATQTERRCTGYFFLAISALDKGDTAAARNYFEKTLATGAVKFRQYDAAKRELNRLNRS